MNKLIGVTVTVPFILAENLTAMETNSQPQTNQEPTPEPRVHGHWILTGDAAQIVLDKIKQMKSLGTPVFGKERAIQVLLCELSRMKNQKKPI